MGDIMKADLKEITYFRKEQKEYGFIIEKVKDYYRRQELAKRTINRYAFSFKNFPEIFTDEELERKSSFVLYRDSEVFTQIEIDGDVKPWAKQSKETNFEDQYLGFRALVNHSSVNTMPARTCVKENGEFDAVKAIDLIDRLIHGSTTDNELKDIHNKVMEMPMFKSSPDSLIYLLLRDFRNFDKFKKSVCALEDFGIPSKEYYLMKSPSKDLQNSDYNM